MEFTVKKPPIRSNQQRSYKRQITLHISLLVVAFASIIVKAFIDVPEDVSWVPVQMFDTLFMLVIGAGTSIIVELLYSISEGTSHEFAKYNRLVDPINTGLIIALLLPSSTPIYALILAVAVGVYVGKIVFGGYGYYIFNPALVGALFATIAFGSSITYGETPLTLLKGTLEGVSYNFNLLELIVGNYNAIAIGSSVAFMLVISFVYLCITRVIDLKISGTYLLAIALISAIVGYINFGGAALNYVLVNMITGLTLFGAVFLISESVSSPTSRETKMIYAVVVAILTMMMRILGSEVEGVIFAILFGNMITPYLNRTVKRSNKNTLIKTSIILFFVVLFTGIALGFILQGRLIDVFQAATMIGGIL